MTHQFADISQKNVTIDSSRRESGTSTNFNINLPIPSINYFNKAAVSYFEMPKAYYLVDSANNQFALDEEAGGSQVNVTISVGNYTAATLATELGTQMSAVSPNGYTYTVTYDSSTNKFTFTHATASSSTDFTITSSNIWDRYLGFTNDLSSTNGIATSDNQIDLQRHNVLYLTADNISNNNDDVLLTIFPSGYSNYSTISYTNPDLMLTAVNVVNNNANQITFTLRDADRNIVDLNNCPIRFVLSMWRAC